MNGNSQASERLMDLLADRATVGLGDAERAELESLLARNPDIDPDSLDQAAATVVVATAAIGSGEVIAMPGSVRQKVEADGQRVVAERSRGVLGPGAGAGSRVGGSGDRGPESGRMVRNRAWWVGWAAAAASLAVAGWALWMRPDGKGERPSLAQLERSAGTASMSWSAWPVKGENEGPSTGAGTAVAGADGVTGRVVWNQESQQGYMVFTGLPVNVSEEAQYQLWIIDSEQAQPIDGGVFDAPRGCCEVAITPKLRVARPVAFAVTVEKPGGVVVSDQKRRVVVAMAPKA